MANVTKNRGELYGEWENIEVRVGSVDEKPEWVVLRIDSDPNKEILFTESEARDMYEAIGMALKEF